MLDLLLNNNFLSAIIAFAIVLIPAIIIHELGHFFAAKMVGINVLEFGIGFPPRMIRLFTWGETEFTLNWLPLGGFVRPLGEGIVGPIESNEDEEEKPKNQPDLDALLEDRRILMARGVPEDKMMSVAQAKPLPRIFFMAAGAFANFVSAIFLFIVIALIGLPTEVGGRVQIADMPDDSPYAEQGVAIGDAIERFNGAYFTDVNDFLAQLRAAQGQVITLTMRSLESNENYDIQLSPQVTAIEGLVFVAGVADNSPADRAGLLAGDLIVRLNGDPLPIDESPIAFIQRIGEALAGTEITLGIWRGNDTLDLVLVPRLDPPPGEGRIGMVVEDRYIADDGVHYIRSTNQQELIPLSFADSISYGFNHTFEIISMIISIPGQIISGAISPDQARPVSIIGISQVGGQFLQQSIRDGNPLIILNFVALVSIFLGFTNLLPIPALDGGRIFFALIELVRGKPVSSKVENTVHYVGFVLLLGLALIIIVYDILNPLVLIQ